MSTISEIKTSEKVLWRKVIRTEITEVLVLPDTDLEEIDLTALNEGVRRVSFIESDDSIRISDLENRQELATMIGLDQIPDITPDSIKGSVGILDQLYQNETEIDTVKMVKEASKSKFWRKFV